MPTCYKHTPACKLNELNFILAAEKSVSVFQKDGSTHEEFKGEICVYGMCLFHRFILWRRQVYHLKY